MALLLPSKTPTFVSDYNHIRVRLGDYNHIWARER
jgi:hypothetical protein